MPTVGVGDFGSFGPISAVAILICRKEKKLKRKKTLVIGLAVMPPSENPQKRLFVEEGMLVWLSARASLAAVSRRVRHLPLPSSHVVVPRLSIKRSLAAMASTASPLAQPEQDRVGHGAGKRPRQDGDSPEQRKAAAAGRRRKKKKKKPVDETSAEGVLLADIRALQRRAGTEEGPEDGLALPELGSHIEVDVVELSSTGDGLGLQPGSRQIYVVPFAAAGDTARVKVFRHVDDEGYSLADFVSATKPSALRDDGRIGCRYFGRCGGCQLQMLAYEEQLRFKQGVVAKAFRNFAQLPAALVPPVQATVGSPLQYGYRTKLTPHFDGPPTRLRKQGLPFDALPPVGFMAKGTRSTLDIEDCPIGTPAVRAGMRRERARMTAEFATYRRGATLLLREDTRRYAKADAPAADAVPPDAIRVDCDGHTDVKTAIPTTTPRRPSTSATSSSPTGRRLLPEQQLDPAGLHRVRARARAAAAVGPPQARAQTSSTPTRARASSPWPCPPSCRAAASASTSRTSPSTSPAQTPASTASPSRSAAS